MIYNLVLSNGVRLCVDAASASEAIGSALIDNEGFTVKQCYAGDATARITFEIPAHRPFAKEVGKKQKQDLHSMFDDAEIKRESAKAKDRAAY